MKSLWFRARFNAAILAGEKRDTVRLPSARDRFKVGDVVGLSNGPRKPFATARIIGIDELPESSLDVEYRELLAGMVARSAHYIRIRFELVEPLKTNAQFAPPDGAK